ncbi:Nitrate reductase NADH [Hondaea fermentalgiana]|uniref:sulfite oxidase n=1 Tax=Hondaea fermentalgiana TaxID=2315210 RepID=A0A2R5GQ57_9STRA|nr:Nitrate reductase NADH [Hondaea fermentalgiana]|eukprot:GBG31908.1 Nitrate reductase NADH [Hondaea fermentalgiana]
MVLTTARRGLLLGSALRRAGFAQTARFTNGVRNNARTLARSNLGVLGSGARGLASYGESTNHRGPKADRGLGGLGGLGSGTIAALAGLATALSLGALSLIQPDTVAQTEGNAPPNPDDLVKKAQVPGPNECAPGGNRAQRCPLGFPYFSRKEVSKHKHAEDRIYVTYKDGVYDVTEFVNMHPGGERILLAAGSAIDPYWAMYQQHSTRQVMEILASLRIGTLYEHEFKELEASISLDDPFANDPPRANLGAVRCQKPYNSETVIELIPDNYITPIPMHYKRHHHPVPQANEADFRLVLAFEDANILQVSTEDLRSRFKKHEFPVTLQCAGNRRQELNKVAPVQGLEWDCGAISTAVWGGCLLRDVLEFTGFGDESALIERAGVKHICFEGLDKPYDASIPIDKALSKFGDVLVAYEMNGAPIPREHGGPVRIIVPGHLAARSVKWCERITASKGEGHSGWQRGIAYKGAPAYMRTFDGVDPETLTSVQELPVNSAICLPRPGSTVDVDDGSVTLKGWAWSGGGRNIIRVDVSVDGGKTWQGADLGRGAEQGQNRAWAWTFWEAEVDIPPELRKPGVELDICCRAVDVSMNHQPERPEAVWNLRGIMNNSYHHVAVTLVREEEDNEDA